MDPTVVDAPQTELGEGPMWSCDEQVLYWIDIVKRRVLRLRPETGRVDVRELPFAPSAVIPRDSGGLLLVTKKGMAHFEFDKPDLASLPVPLVDFSKEVFNDAKCDGAGRMWVGTRDLHVSHPNGGLFCMAPDYSMQRHGSGYTVSNGIAWGDGGRIMYHIESKPGRIDAYDFDATTGALSNRRVFRDYAKEGAAAFPDGCTIDSEGGLWVAEVGDFHIRRYAPDGHLDREVRVPFQKPTSLMFGGRDLATLYVTSMRFGLDEAALARQPLAGSLLQLDVGFAGVPEHRFGG
ncbi:MAG: SMP-30/gluconolactonase/LRE family protein [Burkholderiales bacterium]